MSVTVNDGGRATTWETILARLLLRHAVGRTNEVVLWVTVLVHAIRDALVFVKGKNNAHRYADALAFIRERERHEGICEIIGIEPEYFRRMATRILSAGKVIR